MDIFIIISFLTFTGSAITFLIFKALKKKTNILNKVVFITYTLFIAITAFSDRTLFEAMNSILVMEITYILILLIIFGLKNDPKLFKWLIAFQVLNVLYALNYILLNTKVSGFLDSLSEGVMGPVLVIYFLSIVLLVKKNHQVNILIKTLLVYYIVFSLAFSLSSPLELITVLSSLGLILFVGAIFALILYAIYKKIYKTNSSKKDKGDFNNEEG